VWEEHKKLILGVGGALLALFLWDGCVLGSMRAAAEIERDLRRSRESELRQLLKDGLPEEGALERAQGEAARAEAAVDELIRQMSYPLPPEYAVPERQTAEQHFDAQKVRVYDQLQRAAVARRVSLPATELGFEGVSGDVRRERAGELLARLAVVEGVVRELLDAVGPEGARIESVQPFYSLKGEEVREKGPQFADPVWVRFQITSEPKAAFLLLHRLQQPGAYLCVLGLNAQREGVRDPLAVELVVGALRADRSAAWTQPVEEARW